MTASLSNRRIATEIVASSLGGAFLMILALSLADHQRLLTPAAYQALGLAGAALVLAGLKFRADSRIQVLTLAFTAAAFVGLAVIRSRSLLPDAFLLAASLLMLLFTVWYHRDRLPAYLVLSGGFGGALLTGLITSHYIRVAHGVVLAGVVLAFIVGKRMARAGNAIQVYRRMMITVVVPCVLVFLAALTAFTWFWDLLIGVSAIVSLGWQHVAGDQTVA